MILVKEAADPLPTALAATALGAARLTTTAPVATGLPGPTLDALARR